MQRELILGSVGSIIMALASGCVDSKGTPQKQIDPAYIEKNILTAPPASMTNTVNADLGGKVLYLGNDTEARVLAPGDKVKIVHYWKVLEAPGEKWRVFTHLEGMGQDWKNLDLSDMRVGYGPDKWKAGDIIRDEQEFQLPSSWTSTHAEVLVGLFAKGGHTASDRMPIVSGPADKQSRVKVVRFQVKRDRKPGAAAQGRYVIRKASGPITIDGRADEAAWQSAPESPAFTTAEGSPEIKGETKARMLWDDTNLYVFVSAKDQDVFSSYQKQDDPMWKEDVIELFIDADRSRRGYVELQVNPNNAHFDSWFVTDRRAAADTAWNANMTSAVVVHGSRDERDDSDQGWDVEIAIPLQAVKGGDANMKVNVPPQVGDTWRLNVVRIDKPEDKNLAAASWNAITYQDFHALDRMLEVVFGDAQGSATPASAPGAGSAGGAAQPATGAAAGPGASSQGASVGSPTSPKASNSATKQAPEQKTGENKHQIQPMPKQPADNQ